MKKRTLALVMNATLLVIAMGVYQWVRLSGNKWERVDRKAFRKMKEIGIDLDRLCGLTEVLALRLSQLQNRFESKREDKRKSLGYETQSIPARRVCTNEEMIQMIEGLQVNAGLDIGMNFQREEGVTTYINIPFVFNEALVDEDSIRFFFKLYLSMVNSVIQSHRQRFSHLRRFNAEELFANVTMDNTMQLISDTLLDSAIHYFNPNPLLLFQLRSCLALSRRISKAITSAAGKDQITIGNDAKALEAMLTMLNPIALEDAIDEEAVRSFLSLLSRMTSNISSLKTIQRSFEKINERQWLNQCFLLFCVIVVCYYLNMCLFQNEVLGLNRKTQKRR